MNAELIAKTKAGQLFPGIRLEEFSVKTVVYTASEAIPTIPGCYGYLAVNNCDVVVFVDNFPLLPPAGAGLSGAAFGFMDNLKVYGPRSIDLKIFTGATVLQVIIAQIFKIG